MKKFESMYWAKKFDEVKHIYREGGKKGTICGSVAVCLGNNYAHADMDICPKCIEILREENKPYVIIERG